jgi:hypothetical protein
MPKSEKKMYGLLAEFDTTQAIYRACETVRDEGYTRWDSYTPFPVHGLDKAMGLKASKVPWISLVCGLSGASLGMYLQYWVAAIAYPLTYGGSGNGLWHVLSKPTPPLLSPRV